MSVLQGIDYRIDKSPANNAGEYLYEYDCVICGDTNYLHIKQGLEFAAVLEQFLVCVYCGCSLVKYPCKRQ